MRKKEIRLRLILIISTILMGALVYRLFDFTIVENEDYKSYADNQISREVSITAARGNIYDRNGTLLAGTKPTYVVKIYKDELLGLDSEERNDYVLELVKYLEDDGVNYLEDLDIGINKFTYENIENYRNTESLNKQVANKIIDNNLVEEFILSSYESKGAVSYTHTIIDNVLKQLEKKNIYLPINVKINENGEASLSFTDDSNYLEYESDGKLDKSYYEKEESGELTPIELVMKNIEGNNSIIINLLSHPINRELAYNLLMKNNLQGDIHLTKLIFNDDLNYLINKGSLSNTYRNITFTSDAKDDFYEIVYESSLEGFLKGLYIDDEYNMYIPGEKLISKLKDLGEEVGITFEVDKDATKVTYSYEDEDIKLDSKDPLLILIELGKKHGLFKELILDDNYKYVAQDAIFANGIYPNITIKNWEYTYVKNKDTLLTRYKFENDATAEEIYEKLEDRNSIEYDSLYDSYFTMSILESVRNQGYYAYTPLKLAYRLSNECVAKITESIPTNAGIEVDSEPVRYYPYNELGSHVLGYLGKISQNSEIKKYINEKGYDSSAIIGKTGVEESYESSLKGTDGKKVVRVDNLGNRTDTISETEAVPGNNVYLTINYKAQTALENALEKGVERIKKGGVYESDWGDYGFGKAMPGAKSAAAVVMDIKTGDIIASGSYPSYDPNLFATGITSSDWDLLSTESDDVLAARPLLNMVMQTAVQPGSTFKPMSAISALKKGFNPNTRINCTGFIDIGDTRFQCWIYNQTRGGHGSLNMYEAIENSCNYYFYVLSLGYDPNTGRSLSTKVTVDDVEKTVSDFGLNESTGIDIDVPREAKGTIPSSDIKLSSTKALLRRKLKEDLKNYIKPGTEKTDKKYEEDIEEIVSWLDQGSSMKRSEVSNRLDDLGYVSEERLEGQRVNLTDQIKYNYLNQVEWQQADSMSMIIGQGQNAYTPLQMVRMTSMIANKGNKLEAKIVDKIKNYDDSVLIYDSEVVSENIDYDPGTFEVVGKGMHMAAESGSIGHCFSTLPFQVACKTGTAEVDGTDEETGENYGNYSWFIAYFPYDNPQYAVSLLIPQGGSGSYGAPIIRDIIASVMGVSPDGETEIDTNSQDHVEE